MKNREYAMARKSGRKKMVVGDEMIGKEWVIWCGQGQIDVLTYFLN